MKKTFMALTTALTLMLNQRGAVQAFDFWEESKKGVSISQYQQDVSKYGIGYAVFKRLDEMISTGSIDLSTKEGKIAYLYNQLKTMSIENVDELKNKELAEVDEKVKDKESAFSAMIESQIKFGTFYQQFFDGDDFDGNEFALTNLLCDLPVESTDIPNDEASEKLKEFIAKTSDININSTDIGVLDAEKQLNEFPYPLEKFKKILHCLNSNEGLEKIREVLKEEIKGFYEDIKDTIKLINHIEENSESIPAITKEYGNKLKLLVKFGSYFGSEFYSTLYTLFDYNHADVVSECSEDVKQAYINKINSLVVEQKITESEGDQLKTKLNNVEFSSKAKDLENYNSMKFDLNNLEIKSNFIETVLDFKCKTKEHLRSIILDEDKIHTITNIKKDFINNYSDLVRTGSLFGFSIARPITDYSPPIMVDMDAGVDEETGKREIVKAVISDKDKINISFSDVFFKKVQLETSETNFNKDESLKWFVRRLLAHELGHWLDKSLSDLFKDQELKKNQFEEFKNHIGNQVDLKIGRKLCSYHEVFADYFCVDILHDIAITKEFNNNQIVSAFIAAEGQQDASGNSINANDPHPPYNMRINAVIGNFDWVYELGLNIFQGDPIFIKPEDRKLFLS